MSVLGFGEFLLDVESGELSKAGVKVALPLQPLRLLALLASRPGRLVTREEIRASLWGEGTHVDHVQGVNHCIRRIRVALGDDAESPRYVQTLPRRGYRFLAPLRNPPEISRAAPAGRVMLAVLPFENLSGDPAQEYFSDGLTDEMITELGRQGGDRLGVIARNSAMRYKGAHADPREIGRELGVAYALTGAVRRSGRRVRVSAQLVQVASAVNIWADSYDSELRDILTVQAEAARAIAEKIRRELLPRAKGPARQSVDPKAYDLYLKGLAAWWTRSIPKLRQAVRFQQKAIEREPGFAAAHAALAGAYLTLFDYHLMSFEAVAESARPAAERALSLDGKLAAAHSAMGHLLMHGLDWAAAGQRFSKAADLNANDLMTRYYRANYLVATGRFDEALEEARFAISLDPNTPVSESNAANIAYLAGRFDEAEAHCRQSLARDPGHWMANYHLSQVRAQRRDARGAVTNAERAFSRSGRSSRALGMLARACAIAGDRHRSEKMLRELRRPGNRRFVSVYGLAEVELALGRTEEAIRGFEAAYAQRDAEVLFIGVDPALRELRKNPRMRALLKRAGMGRFASTRTGRQPD